MKEIKLSFPYPSTSRHNLSQDVALSASMGLLIPVRVLEVLPGDSHRISTSYSLVSNPLVKPLLQGVMMRVARFWVPSRIYHINLRANNSGYDPRVSPVRMGTLTNMKFPGIWSTDKVVFKSNFQASSLFDYLRISSVSDNMFLTGSINNPSASKLQGGAFDFNAEPYIAYLDICRNFYGDSSTGTIAFYDRLADSSGAAISQSGTVVSSLARLDRYIDGIQNNATTNGIYPYDFANPIGALVGYRNDFAPFFLPLSGSFDTPTPLRMPTQFDASVFGLSHVGLCVPMNRPDRYSRLFNTEPLTSQNATVSSSEITISNLSFLAKLQKYLTRVFFGGSRYTDIMYSVFGQKVPHVDSPVLLDVFDSEIGSELVSSTNATSTQNPGVLGGYFSSSGVLSTARGRSRKRYSFNERGYLIDLVYIMPRIFRASYLPDFYPLVRPDEQVTLYQMQQGNFVPDFNGIGWQQPAFLDSFRRVSEVPATGNTTYPSTGSAFCCEPSWQQYRTLPDVCSGLMNPIRGVPGGIFHFSDVSSVSVNSPIYTFSDRMLGNTFYRIRSDDWPIRLLSTLQYTEPSYFNTIFGVSSLQYDNIFIVFRYSHQAKRQVSKRFTLTLF